MKNDNFKFYFPADIEKAKNEAGGEVMKFKGLASTSDKDSQGEFLDPAGFDLSEFKWVNWNHHGSKNPATIIGEPTKKVLSADKKELYIEGLLYPGVQMAQDAWNLMKALKNSPSGNKLSLSVEGKVIQRGCDPEFLDEEKKIKNPNYSLEKWNKIIKSKITGVAICPVPVNGKTWADMITKGVSSDELEEEYDDETKKVINTLISQEEGIMSDDNCKLKKSEVYEKIYDRLPNIEIEKAKLIYSLIEKTANTMSKETVEASAITDDTIKKAFEILDLANNTIIKGEGGNNNPPAKQALDEDEDEDEKEMVKKAKNLRKAMSADKKDNDSIKAALIKKGYGEKVIEKAMKDDDNGKGDSVSKSELEDLLKSQSDSLTKVLDTKLNVVGTILKKSLEENDLLKKSLEESALVNSELLTKVEGLMKQVPNGPKSFLAKSYTERFGEEGNKGGEGSKPKYNLNNAKDRGALKDMLTEKSGIMKGESFDQGLVNIAQEIEIAKSVTPESARRLVAMGIEVVVE